MELMRWRTAPKCARHVPRYLRGQKSGRECQCGTTDDGRLQRLAGAIGIEGYDIRI